jgi:hypothetical protein
MTVAAKINPNNCTNVTAPDFLINSRHVVPPLAKRQVRIRHVKPSDFAYYGPDDLDLIKRYFIDNLARLNQCGGMM